MTGNGQEEAIELTMRAMRRGSILGARLAERSGLAASDAAALRALDVLAAGECPVGELAAVLGLSSAASTGLVDRLERAGLAARRRDGHDRRRVLVALTPTARDFGQTTLAPVVEHVSLALQDVPPDHLPSVVAVLRALAGDEDG